MKNIRGFFFLFLKKSVFEVKFSIYFNRRVFVKVFAGHSLRSQGSKASSGGQSDIDRPAHYCRLI